VILPKHHCPQVAHKNLQQQQLGQKQQLGGSHADIESVGSKTKRTVGLVDMTVRKNKVPHSQSSLRENPSFC
jgi:hypothetical protein